LIGLGLAAVWGCAPRRAAPKPPPVTPYVGGLLTAREWGVGPIRVDTFFESPRIRALFPRAEVKDAVVQIAPDETRDVITVSQDGVQLLEVVDGFFNFPGTDDPEIGRVRLVGGPVRGARGETLGMSWNAARFDLSQCEVGTDRDKNTVICVHPEEGAVAYVFAAPGWDSEELPSESLLRAHGYLKTIIWTPTRPRRVN
jgi:hypothetical protein